MSDDRRDTEQPNDEPSWPPSAIEGEPIPLPGMDEVTERPAERGGYPS
jgi:hypothetical protein